MFTMGQSNARVSQHRCLDVSRQTKQVLGTDGSGDYLHLFGLLDEAQWTGVAQWAHYMGHKARPSQR